MAVALGVHGISQQRSGRVRQLKRWRDALRDGMKSAGYERGSIPTLGMAFYGDLFRKGSPYLDLGEAEEQQWDDPDEADFVSAVLDELMSDLSAEQIDDLVGSGLPLGLPGVIPPKLLRKLAAANRRWGVGKQALLVWDLRQVYAYLFRPEAGEKIRGLVTEAVNDETRVLIGHSLGSVITYDMLLRGELPQISALVTLGSPLSLNSVWSAVPNAGRILPNVLWLNVYDPKDVVTMGTGMAPFADDIPVTNRMRDPHAAVEYLAQKKTARAIMRACDHARC